MKRAVASRSAGLLVAMLMIACMPRYVAPNEELRANTRSLRAHGVTVTAPADLREEPIADEGAAPHPRYHSWAGQRVWIAIHACSGVGDYGTCDIQGQERPPVRAPDAAIRRFASQVGRRPREVVWVTPDGASYRTVVLIIGRTHGDSALVRRIGDTVQSSPD